MNRASTDADLVSLSRSLSRSLSLLFQRAMCLPRSLIPDPSFFLSLLSSIITSLCLSVSAAAIFLDLFAPYSEADPSLLLMFLSVYPPSVADHIHIHPEHML